MIHVEKIREGNENKKIIYHNNYLINSCFSVHGGLIFYKWD